MNRHGLQCAFKIQDGDFKMKDNFRSQGNLKAKRSDIVLEG